MALADDETGNLIGSDKVQGTAVFGRDGDKIGNVERLMIDKISGRVSYAVLSFGGFLGAGNDYYPLPWQSLQYDEGLGGYLTAITNSQLTGAPKYASDNDWNWGDPELRGGVDDYYRGP
jgi:sporulation protein YlmC with PRC-barrel domain